MTDKDLESGQQTVESDSQSQLANAGDKQASSSASKPQEQYGERLARIEKMVSSLQSDKDRGVKQALGEVSELRKAFGEVKNLMGRGLSEDEAFEQLESRKTSNELREAIFELRDALKGGQLSTKASGAVSAAEVVAELGLPEVPEVVAFKQRSFNNRNDAVVEAAKLAAELAKKPLPNDAQRPAVESGAQARVEEDVEAETENFKKDMRAARGKTAELDAIKKKYLKKNVNIYEVDFT